MLAATFAAFALRVGLARGDLWGDEAASVTMSLKPVAEVLRNLAVAEPHPPAFPLLLKAWMRLVGTDEMAVRFPSIAFGTLTVPAVGALGRSAALPIGAIAAVLTAASPFLLWYGTEVRMYSLAALLAAASWLALVRLLARPDRFRILAYGFVMGAALLAHYYLLFVGLAHAVVGAAAVIRSRGLVRPLGAAGALALAPFAIWALYAGRVVSGYYGAAPGTPDLAAIALNWWTRVLGGWSIPLEQARAIALVSTPLILLGAFGAARRGSTRPWLIWLSVPLAAGALVSVVRPMFQERYLAALAPAVLLLAATGVHTLWTRSARAVALACLLFAAAIPLWNLAAGRYVRSEYGSHTAQVNALGRPGDVVLLTGTSQAPLYEYYASRGGVGLPVFGLPRDPPASVPATTDDLAGIVAGAKAIWLFLYAVDDYDPARVVETWLTEHAFRAPMRWTVNGRLGGFVTEGAARLNPGTPVQLGQWRVEAALPAAPVSAASLLPIRLDLIAPPGVADVPKLRLRVLDARGFIWGEADEPLGAGVRPTIALSNGERWTERRAVLLHGGAPQGEYAVEAQLYHESPGGPQAIGSATLGKVALQPSDSFWGGEIAGLQRRSDLVVGGWALVGYAGADRRRGGERGYVTTVWRRTGEADGEQRLRVVAPDGREMQSRTEPLPRQPIGTYARLQLAPPVGARWPAGDYRVELGVGEGFHELYRMRVEPGDPPPRSQPAQHVLEASFGDAIGLRGYSLSGAELTLHWRALADVPANYHVFVHVLDPGGTIRGQSDGPPRGGAAPTDSWTRGDEVDDPRRINVPSGIYRVVVGLYDPASGARLRTEEADHVELGLLSFGG